VIYRPETERASHYLHPQLGDQFDAVFHDDETSAMKPLDRTPTESAAKRPKHFRPASEPQAQSGGGTAMQESPDTRHFEVSVDLGEVSLKGDLVIPSGASAIVVFAHGSGSSRLSPRNRFVAEALNKANLATLLFDLLTPEEEQAEAQTRHLRFDIALLARRLSGAVDWAGREERTKNMRIGLFGASTGAAAALVTATERPDRVAAVVSRGGRPDLAGDALPDVSAPTLLIVGGADTQVIELNREAAESLQCETRIDIVPDASHLFEEPGALEQVADLARQWFERHLIHEAQTA